MSDRFLPHIAAEIVGKPLLILEEKLGIIANVLGGRIGIEDPDALALGPDASRFAGRRQDPETREWLTYARTDDGVAVITITGSLVNRGAWVGASSGLTSYEGIKFQLAKAVADPKVKTIVLDLESPGGLALGAPEAAEAVRAAAQAKPVIAMVNGLAASAAYWLASAATRIVTAPSGVAGSIGVKMLHVDYSRKLDREGITPTLLSAPDDGSKALGNSFEPLSADARERLLGEINKTYGTFVAGVAQGRKGLSQKAIRALGAHVYTGQDAVDAGLADEIGTFESVLSTLSSGGGRRSSRSMRMANDSDLIYTRVDYENAVAAAHTKGRAEGVAEGASAHATALAAAKAESLKEGAQAERDRLVQIFALDEAKDRDDSARRLALTTSMGVDEVKGLLATLPKAGGLAARASATPDIGGGPATPPDAQEAIDKTYAAFAADLNKRHGVKA